MIRINPLARAGEPTAIAAIADRRNELPGNLSLQQELYFIGKVNQWADWLGGRYRHIEVRERALDLASKLDRRAGSSTKDGTRRSDSLPGYPDSQRRSSPRSDQRGSRVAEHYP